MGTCSNVLLQVANAHHGNISRLVSYNSEIQALLFGVGQLTWLA